MDFVLRAPSSARVSGIETPQKLLVGQAKLLPLVTDSALLETKTVLTTLDESLCLSGACGVLAMPVRLHGVLLPKSKSLLCASYLVDLASSHMLVSKIKPCMSKYKPH